MAQVILHINENPVVWTALFWTFALGTLYLVFHLGSRSAAERGLKTNSWGTVALLLGLGVAVAMFGMDDPFQGLILKFSRDEWMVFLVMFLIVTVTYIGGYLFSFTKAARYGNAHAASANVPSLPQ